MSSAKDQPRPAAATTDGPAPSRTDVPRLAHELRTPLSAISVLAEMIRDERIGPVGQDKYRAYAADIHQSAAHAMRVLASWSDAGQFTSSAPGSLDFVELDPATFVESVVSALTPLAERVGVRLETELSGRLPHLITDRRSLQQILIILISNSLKYTPPGGRIVVRLQHLPARGLNVVVADTGDGMTPAELTRVTADSPGPEPLRRRSGGTGQGLPIARTQAAAVGARLSVASALGQGTTVTLAFGPDRILPV